MASAIAAATEAILALTFKDFRGQPLTRRYQLKGGLTDIQITTIVDTYDAVTNCQIVKAQLETIRVITGMKGAAVNALERNESEQMELAFFGTDAISHKTVTKTVIIPAMVAAIETLDGSVDTTNAAINAFIAAIGPDLAFTQADGTINTFGMAFLPDESHHITVADKVDTV